jgi:hypothetical protein
LDSSSDEEEDDAQQQRPRRAAGGRRLVVEDDEDSRRLRFEPPAPHPVREPPPPLIEALETALEEEGNARHQAIDLRALAARLGHPIANDDERLPLALRAVFMFGDALCEWGAARRLHADTACALAMLNAARTLPPRDDVEQFTAPVRALCVWARQLGAANAFAEARVVLAHVLRKLLWHSRVANAFPRTDDAIRHHLPIDRVIHGGRLDVALYAIEDALDAEAAALLPHHADDDAEAEQQRQYARFVELSPTQQLTERLKALLHDDESATRSDLWREARRLSVEYGGGRQGEHLPLILRAVFLFLDRTQGRPSKVSPEALEADRACAFDMLCQSEHIRPHDKVPQLACPFRQLCRWARDLPDAERPQGVDLLRPMLQTLIRLSGLGKKRLPGTQALLAAFHGPAYHSPPGAYDEALDALVNALERELGSVR